MKIIKKILLVLPALLLCMSCNDFLDKAPENSRPEDTVDYTDLTNMYSQVSGVYGLWRTEGAHWIIWGATLMRDDDVNVGKTGDQTALDDIDKTYYYDKSFWGFNEAFSVCYFPIIKYCNSALEALLKYEVNCKTPQEKALNLAYQGEVHCMRAMAYYRLVQLFGAVPILKTNEQTNFRRQSIEKVYAYALEDLDFAITNCEKLRPNQMAHKGAITSYTAQMVAAKIQLNLGKYDKVKELTDNIIERGNFELYPDFYELFKIPGKLCNESLFEIQATDFGQGSGDKIDLGAWFSFQGPVNNTNISGWGFISPSKEFRTWAKNRGETVRAETTFLMTDATTRSGDYVKAPVAANHADCYNGKAYTPLNELTPGRTDYGCNNNARVLRYADVLLMNVEAKVRLGQDLGKALTNMNLIRNRAQMPELTAGQLTLESVLDERRMELSVEWGERFNDLVRTGKAEAVLGSKGYNSSKQYFPIPTTAITSAPDLALDPE
ncbi:MAG: RagB/SusD family nutrient uptake outer membrane protein [Muribaculaceae bacterium]